MNDHCLSNAKRLGFGLMRLPKVKDTETIDIEETKKMVDAFLEAGMNYFDTAYIYEGSEEAIGKALVQRYPRESYYLTSKLNVSAKSIKNEADAKNEINISLERTGSKYFDYYLLHALSRSNIDKFDAYHCWDYVKELKEKGLIKHYGFSYHDGPEFLDEILTKHPDVEFVQLQINYADYYSLTVQSKENYEVCVKHNKPVIVMEPIKGGTLANPPQRVVDVFEKANNGLSIASWAVRFVASLDQVAVVLSGMSNMSQMEDNLSYMKDFKKLSKEEEKVIKQAMDALNSVHQVACTACHYCTSGCPMQIDIPSIFSAMNKKYIFDRDKEAKKAYENATSNHSLASKCIKCGACEAQCPQHLPIRKYLEDAVKMFEE